MKKVKLFCIPYAGGSAIVFNQWKKYLHESIELCPIELAGRGRRIKESFYSCFEQVINDVYDLVHNDVGDSPYAIFGHSMGSTLAYEVCCKITELSKRRPMAIYLSGRSHPNLSINNKKLHLLENRELMDEIVKFGGVPKEYIESQALIDFFLPIIKADLKILENYIHKSKVYKLDIKFNIFYGKQDSITKANDMQAWNMYTQNECRFYEFEGDHFFINENVFDVVNAINESLIAEI